MFLENPYGLSILICAFGPPLTRGSFSDLRRGAPRRRAPQDVAVDTHSCYCVYLLRVGHQTALCLRILFPVQLYLGPRDIEVHGVGHSADQRVFTR